MYITGVQLEAGTSASDFEFLPVDVNLQRCQRYYQEYISGTLKVIGIGSYYSATQVVVPIKFSKTMRTAPSLVQQTGTNFYFVDKSTGTDNLNGFTGGVYSSPETILMYNSTEASGTTGNAFSVMSKNDASAFIAF